MAHVRTQIRTAVAALLTGLATTGANIKAGRVNAVPQDECPALSIFVDEEAIDLGNSSAPMQLARTASVRVRCHSALLDGLDDELDQMALEVEEALAGDDTLSGLLNEPLRPVGIEVDRTGQGEKPIGELTLTFAANYETTNAAPDTAL